MEKPTPRHSLYLATLMLAELLVGCSDKEQKKEFADDISQTVGEVEVIRDTHGIPHIYADSDNDAALVAGYEMARDRLFQMDTLRRTAQGRLSEVYGEKRNGKDNYAFDQLARAVGFQRIAGETAEILKKDEHDTYEIVSAFAVGVNAYIADALAGQNGADLPYGFGPQELDYTPDLWTVVDSLAILKASMWMTTQTEIELIVSLATVMSGDSPYLDDLFLFLPCEEEFILDGFPTENAFDASSILLESRDHSCPPPPPDSVPDDIFRRGLKYAAQLKRLGLGIASSNNWSISGELTASGRSIVANDPHLGLECPPVLYLIHYSTLDGHGTLDVAGGAFPGVPGIGIGFNRQAAWGTTIAFGDSADLFGVKFSADGKSAIFPDGNEKLEIRKEIIRVRPAGGSLDDCEERELEIKIVPRYGPILPGDAELFASLFYSSNGIALKWTGSQPTLEMKAELDGNRARSPAGFQDALLFNTIGAMNWVYGDRDGNIAHSAYAHYPIRKNLSWDTPPWKVLPSDGDFDWTGEFLPASVIPHALNPERGFIVTANNDPVGVTADNNPLNDQYYLGWSYSPGFRAYAISSSLAILAESARLNPDAKITAAAIKSLQISEHSRLFDNLLPHLQQAWSTAQAGGDPVLEAFAANPDVQAAYNMLDSWDGEAHKDSAPAALFYAFASYFNALSIRDELSSTVYDAMPFIYTIRPLLAYLNGRSSTSGRDYFDDLNTPEQVETMEQVALRSLDMAYTFLKERFPSVEPDQWRWGEYQQLTIPSLFGERLQWGPFERGGMDDTINVNGTTFHDTANQGGPPETMLSQFGAAARLVISFDEDGWPVAEFALPGGQSGDPDDPHFEDLLDDWLNNQYRRFWFKRADVEAARESSHIYPAGFPLVD